MDAGEEHRGGKTFLDVLVGVEVGVLGALVSLFFFALISPVLGDPWWLVPNLFASHFYSEYHVRAGVGAVTAVGAAVYVISSGAVGVLNGVLTPGGRLFGLGVALVWYLFCHFYLWKRMAPLVPVYAWQPVLVIGWFLFGSTLGWHPWFAAHVKGPRKSPAS